VGATPPGNLQAVSHEDRGGIGHFENRRCARWRTLLRGGRLRPDDSKRSDTAKVAKSRR
jgi:hypothetical protein